MKKFAFCDPETGEIRSIVTPADDNAYEEGVQYGSLIAYEVDFNINNAQAIQTKYRKPDGTWGTKSSQPSPHHSWNNENNTWELNTDHFWAAVRNQRNQFLLMTDWTQIPDNNLDEAAREEWRLHRQALRDMTTTNSSVTSHEDLVWPAIPGQE
jgi:hypothetical protein